MNMGSNAAPLAARMLALVAAPLVFLLMGVTVVDVIGRYVFNRPLYGGYEITELMMGIVVFATLPTVSTKNDHVTIGVNLLGATSILDRYRRAAIEVLCAVALGLVAWRVAVLGNRAFELGDRTILLQLPVAPFAYAVAMLCAISVLIHIQRAATALRDRAHGARQ